MGLTAAQRKVIDEAIVPVKADAMCTDPIHRDECIAAFNAVYAARGLPPPQYVFCATPWEIMRKLDAVAANEKDLHKQLGDTVTIGEFAVDLAKAWKKRWDKDPVIVYIQERLAKLEEGFRDMAAVLHNDLQNSSALALDILVMGDYESLWYWADSTWERVVFAAMNIAPIDKAYTVNYAALNSCHCVFAYKRHCFICDRPVSFHHPALTKEGPRDRIIIKWRDGFEFNTELVKY